MSDRIVTPGSEISPDTGVGYDFDQVPPGVAAEPSEADPEALIEGNRVSTGDELERDADPTAG
jgi:hypothetical protein